MADKFNDSMTEVERGQSEPVPGAADVFGLSELQERRSRQVQVVYHENAIQRHDDGTMTYKRFTMTPVGLILPEKIEIDEWNDVGQVIRDLETSISWVIGDWALYAKREWNAMASEIAKAFGYETSTVETYVSICESIPRLIRNQTANFSHHRLVAKLGDRDLQATWLYYMGFFRLRIADAKVDMAHLVSYESEQAISLLIRAVEENKTINEFDEFKKRPTKKSSRRDDPYEQRNNWLDYIRAEEPKRAFMSPDQLERLAERYEWLGKHFMDEAKSIKGK
jgi:hypothetical protein